jgi:hypothetical protein
MSMVITLVLLAAAGVVMTRCVVLVAHLSPKRWIGPKWQLLGLASAYALIGGGAIGALLVWPASSVLMVVGLAMLFIFDRRA